jgi:hypothetical protein
MLLPRLVLWLCRCLAASSTVGRSGGSSDRRGGSRTRVRTRRPPKPCSAASGSTAPRSVFDRFHVVDSGTERIWDDSIGPQPTGAISVAPAPEPTRRDRAMPLDRDVIVLPARS